MPDPTAPNRRAQAFRALNHQRQLDAPRSQAAAFRARLVDAAGVDPDSLTPQAQRTLHWPPEWDDPTITGLAEILEATRRTAGEGNGR